MADRSIKQPLPAETRKNQRRSGPSGTQKETTSIGSPTLRPRKPHHINHNGSSGAVDYGSPASTSETEAPIPAVVVAPKETSKTNGWVDDRAEDMAEMRKKIHELEDELRRRKEKCKRRKQEKLSLTSTLNQYLKQIAEGEQRQEQLQTEVHALKEFSTSLVTEKETLLEQLNNSYEEQQLLTASVEEREKDVRNLKQLEEDNKVLLGKISETLHEVNSLTTSNQAMHSKIETFTNKMKTVEAAHELLVQKKDQHIKALEEEMESIKELWRSALETQSQLQNDNLKLLRRIDNLEGEIKAVADPNPKLAVEKLLIDREPLLMYACKSMTDKTALFSHAIKTEDADVILTVVLFLEYSLVQKNFEQLLFSSPEGTKCYLQYLKKKDPKQFKALALRSKHFEEVGLYLFEKSTLEQDTQKRIERLEKCLEFSRKYNCLQAHVNEIEGWLIDHKLKPITHNHNIPAPPKITVSSHQAEPVHFPPSKHNHTSVSFAATAPTTTTSSTTTTASNTTHTQTTNKPTQPKISSQSASPKQSKGPDPHPKVHATNHHVAQHAYASDKPTPTAAPPKVHATNHHVTLPMQASPTKLQINANASDKPTPTATPPKAHATNHHVTQHAYASDKPVTPISPKAQRTQSASEPPHSIAQSQFKELVQTVKTSSSVAPRSSKILSASHGETKKIVSPNLKS